MKIHYKNKWVKTLFAVFFILGLGMTFFLFSRESINGDENASKPKKVLHIVNTEATNKKNILDSLTILKLAYDKILLEKTSLSAALELEKKNVENLIDIIKASQKPSSSEIEVYRKQLSNLKNTLDFKIQEINMLKSENKSLLTEIESQNVVMYKQKAKNDTLISQQKKLESTIKTASKLDLENFKVVGLHEKKSGKESETDKAKNVNKLKASFSIGANSVAKTGKRVFYVQVLDQKNNVLGENKLIEFGSNKALVYSFIVATDFQGKPVNIYGILNGEENEFKKGTYFVNFFDKQEIIGNTSITLK